MLMLLTAKCTSLTNLSPLFVRRLIRVEKYISCTSGREMEFKTKYIVYLSVVSVKRVLPVHVFCFGFIRQTAHVSQLFLFKSPHLKTSFWSYYELTVLLAGRNGT